MNIASAPWKAAGDGSSKAKDTRAAGRLCYWRSAPEDRAHRQHDLPSMTDNSATQQSTDHCRAKSGTGWV